MGITDRIEAFINELIRQQSADEEWLEIGRNELATVFGCVPSQINYVISTRFSPERGYMVQSRRGGGGYIRIRRVCRSGGIADVVGRIGTAIEENTVRSVLEYLCESGELDSRSANIIFAAASDNAIPLAGALRNEVRAAILKNALMAAGEQ